MYLLSHNMLIDNLTKLIIEIKKKNNVHAKVFNIESNFAVIILYISIYKYV
jgi:hypothetical protein